MDPCQDFHQCALARAILTYQSMYFAWEQAKVHPPQGLHTAKMFGNPTEFNDGFRRIRHWLPLLMEKLDGPRSCTVQLLINRIVSSASEKICCVVRREMIKNRLHMYPTSSDIR